MSSSSSDKMSSEDTMVILLATDIHLGYAENDPIRGEDSFNTFEEIMTIADKQKVDMIILGGDLFHDNKPSPKCIHRCMSTIRNYCMGDRPISIEFLSDQSQNFQNAQVNYEDPNLNISIPIFSIHGNHDDPSGHGRISALDILSASGLINYFGTWNDLKAVDISPLLMRKGETYLALFGLSHIPDDRICRLFRSNKINFFRPKEQPDMWFNMFVLHQNRVNRNLNYVDDKMIPSFFDLVMWGHEHECLIRTEWNSTQDFRITQPGSPVATSLSEGEAVPKHVGLLKISKKKFHLQPIPLKTVRPFIFDTINLSECRINMNSKNAAEEVQKYVQEYVENLIEQSKSQLTGHEKQPTLPLIRLRVEYSKEIQAFNIIRFGEKFHGKIANPDHLIRLLRERKEHDKEKKNLLDLDTMQDLMKKEAPSVMWENRIEAVLEEYFNTTKDSALQVLSVKGMTQATERSIIKDDRDAIPDIVKHQTDKVLKYLERNNVKDEDIVKEIEAYRSQRSKCGTEEEDKDALAVLNDQARLARIASSQTADAQDENDDDEPTIIEDDSDGDSANVTVRNSRGRGRGRGRGETSRARSSRPRRGRGSRIKL